MITNGHKIEFGEEIRLDVPLPTPQKRRILTEYLGLPEDLHNKVVLELFSGDVDSSFKPEVVERSDPKKVASNYVGVDLSESTGIEHITEDVYKVVDELPAGSFDYVIMNHPPIWCTMARADDWRRKNRNRLTTPTLADAEEFTKFIGRCTRLIKPKRGNKISVAHGFAMQDINALWRHASSVIPQSNEWTIWPVPRGEKSPFTLFDKNGNHVETLHFEDHALQLIHL